MSNDTLELHFVSAARALSALVLCHSVFFLSACSVEVADEASGERAAPGAAASAVSALLLAGARETLVDGITAAENSTFTSGGRLFVSGDDGVYEITRDGKGTRAMVRSSPGECKFAGMAEARGVLYANCYDGTNAAVFAAALDPAPVFRSIYDLPGVALANGAAADAAGRLYVADSTHGTIWRLTIDPANPFAVTRKEAFSTGNLFPNGLKVFDSALYFTDFVAIKRLPLLPGGGAGPVTTLNAQLTFFDDLHVDAKGIIVANFLFGALDVLTPGGVDVLDTAAFGLSGPSSVVPALGRLGLANTDLVVTEKTANRLSVLHPR
jgi:hypothetical protein